MDNGPLWSKDDVGNYWLVFPNKHALTKEEIKEIFSKFGKIKNITTAGNEKGLRFVQYTTLKEVENAVENLKNHSSIKLIPHRPKNKKTTTTNSDEGAKDNLNNINESTRNLEITSPPRLNSSIYLQKLKGLQNSRPSSVTSKPCDIIIKDSLLTCDEPPPLVTKSKSNHQHRKIMLSAEEIIVGNIHNDYGCAFILHLFEKFEPLAISHMQTISRSDTRYCHVYFKSLQDSLEVETIFDGYDLAGKKLIVLRPCRLIEGGN